MTEDASITQADRDAAGDLWRALDMGDIGPNDGLAAIILETMAAAFARRVADAAKSSG